jgi:hypothetical protein
MLLLLLLTLLLQLATHWVLLHHAFHVASSTQRAVNVHLDNQQQQQQLVCVCKSVMSTSCC